MKHKWISYYSDVNSVSTGQMLCLSRVCKIRTFTKNNDRGITYNIVFEGDSFKSGDFAVWQYLDLEKAEQAILDIVSIVEDIELTDSGITVVKNTQLYQNMMKGFAK